MDSLWFFVDSFMEHLRIRFSIDAPDVAKQHSLYVYDLYLIFFSC